MKDNSDDGLISTISSIRVKTASGHIGITGATEIIAKVRQHDKQSEWVSVEDRLPENTGKFLVWDSFLSDIRTVFYHKIGAFHPTRLSQELCRDITHWQPLPSPPGKD